MITIVGKLRNVVDCSCYEVEAVPAPEPKAGLEECSCDEIEAVPRQEAVTSRSKVDVKGAFCAESIRAQGMRLWRL